MKPYIMQYSETIIINDHVMDTIDSTRKTFSIESDDNDYLDTSVWTTITKVSEATDQDSIFLVSNPPQKQSNFDYIATSTLLTERTENNDDDYISLSTIITNVTESQDDDYIYS
ncbi:hypothetical protein OKB61_004207 [Citrobacter freundii]|nr:hypothetical protein [Citrobacter freundii]